MKGDFVKVLRLKDANNVDKPGGNKIRTTVSKVKLRANDPYKAPGIDKKAGDQKNSSITEYMNR